MAQCIRGMQMSLLAVACLAGAAAKATGADAGPAAQPALLSQLSALEDRAYAAWKSGDTRVWARLLSRKFVGWGPAGRLDKSGAEQALSGAGCQILSSSLTNAQLTRLTPDVAVLTHRTEVDGACGGRPLPPASYTASGYVREAGGWKLVFRAQSAIVDPLKASKPAGSEIWTGGPTARDAGTMTLLPREQGLWEAWKDRDARRLAPRLAADVQFIDIFGHHLATRAESLKTWSGEGCDVKRFNLAGARATMLTADVGILTERATAVGTCFGQAVWPVWGSTFYVRRGGRWLWSFGINVLAGAG